MSLHRANYEEAILALVESLRDTAQHELEIGSATDTARVNLRYAATMLERMFSPDEDDVQRLISEVKGTADRIQEVLQA